MSKFALGSDLRALAQSRSRLICSSPTPIAAWWNWNSIVYAICLPTDLCGIIREAQRGARQLNLQSAGAGGMNRLFAFLSRGEDRIHRLQPSLFARVCVVARVNE
ncbi:MAG: hypothetical protein AB1817_21575 [Chloroflexota bacterium]